MSFSDFLFAGRVEKIDLLDLLRAPRKQLALRQKASSESGSSSQASCGPRCTQEIQQIDFFDAPGKQESEKLMSEIEQRLHATSAREQPLTLSESQGQVWVTRRGVKVDRIGSAWLICRFIAPQASFRFVEPDKYQWQQGRGSL